MPSAFEFDPDKSAANKATHGIDFVEAQQIWTVRKSASSRSAARVQTKKRDTSQTRALSAARLDEMHDAGEDLSAHLELAKTTRPGREVQRVNVDFPVDLLRAIDREAKRIGVTRQAFIKLRLADTLASSH
jgi:uncharacterized DUF497 family protein